MKHQLVEELMTEDKPLKAALEEAGMAKSSYYYRSVGQRKTRALDETLVRSISEVRPGICRGLRVQEGHYGPQD